MRRRGASERLSLVCGSKVRRGVLLASPERVEIDIFGLK